MTGGSPIGGGERQKERSPMPNSASDVGARRLTPTMLPSDRLRSCLVREATTKEVYSANVNWRRLDAAEALRAQHISGLPVVDDSDAVVGVVSEKDIVRALHESHGVGSPRGILDLILAAGGVGRTELVAEYMPRLEHGRVREARSPKPVTVDPEITLGDAARILRQYHVNRLPVLENGKLVGILTRQDILVVLGSARGTPGGASASTKSPHGGTATVRSGP